jgi:hypothetical protein
MFISILYMFRAAMCPSSGEFIVSIQHLVYVTLQSHPNLHTKQSFIQSDILDVLKKLRFVKSVYHRTIQLNHQPDATIFPVYYPEIYLQLNMFWGFSRPSSGAQ